MSVLRDLINTVDNTQNVTDEVKENLHILMSLADNKVQQFSDEIMLDLKTGKTTDDMTIPITKITSKYMESRALTKDSTSDIMKEVTDVISGIVTDPSASNIINGIGKFAKKALDTIMGTGEGMEQEVKIYTVTPDYPAIVRYDFAIWGRNIHAASLREHCEMAFACVVYKSAVDVTKLEFNDFLTVYAPVLVSACGADQSKMEEMITQAEKVFYRFKPKKENQNAAPFKVDYEQAIKTVLKNSSPRMSLSPARKPEVGLF